MIELMVLKVLMCMISASKECVFCQYWYFLDKGFKFQQTVMTTMIYK